MALNFDVASSTRRVDHGSGSTLDNLAAGADGFCVWVWVLRLSDGVNQHILSKENATPNRGWLLSVDDGANGACRAIVTRSVARTSVYSAPGMVRIRTPTFVAAQFLVGGSPEVTFYSGQMSGGLQVSINGTTEIGSGSPNDDSAANLYAGNLQRANTNPFRGVIGPYGVVNRRVSLAELRAVRDATLRRSTFLQARLPGTVLLVDPCNAGAPQIDWSGNGNNGTVTAATDYADFVRAPSNERRKLWIPVAAGGSITGTGVITLGSITVEGTAERAVTGTGSIALGAITVAATANRSYAATGGITLGSIAVNGAGIREVTGTGAIALGSATVNGTGEREVTGVGAVTLGAATVDGTGTVTSAGAHTGTGVIVLGAVTVAGAGVREVTGTGAITLSGLQVAVTANRSYTATGEIVLNGIQVSGAGPTVADEIVTGGFWHAFEQAQLRRKKKLREIEEAEEEAQSIKEKMDREIALLLREQERQDAERQEQERLRELARRYATDRAQDLYGERVAKAMARAAVQGNFSAIEALVREAKRAQEEEIFLLQATALAIELNA